MKKLLKNIVKVQLNNSEIIALLFKYIAFSGFTAFLFYNSPVGMIPGGVVGIWYIKFEIEKLERKKLKVEREEFSSMIIAIESALAAGQSFENACISAHKDLSRTLSKRNFIIAELVKIKRGLEINIPISSLLYKVSEDFHIPEPYDFALIVDTANRTGGNTVKIIKDTVEDITRKLSVEDEIEVLLAAKKLEQKIMSIMPYFMIMYLRITNFEYISALYEGVFGRIFMSVCLILIVICDAIGSKIMDIRL